MDYKRIKQKLSIRTVLAHYNLLNGLRDYGNRLVGPCPVHRGDNSTAFHADLEKNLWNCFTRRHGGTVIDMIMELEKVTPSQACLIAEKLLGENRNTGMTYSQMANRILTFRLNLEVEHLYLDRRNISMRTREYFGIGYCSKGMFAGRICIPIHDENGNLVAYAGRSPNGREPKYLFPKGFRKSLVIYNYHRISGIKNSRKVVLVEGYFDVFRLFQAGYPAVALMGSSISKRQKELLVSLKKFLILMFDGDPAGAECTEKLITALRGKRAFRVVRLGDGLQPDTLSEEELRKILH